MSVASLYRLGELIISGRDKLLADWGRQVMELPSAQDLDTPTLIDHIPEFLGELAVALQLHADDTIADSLVHGTPPAHGLDRLENDFDLAEVVAEYNILRGCIHDLAEEHDIVIRGATFHILNRMLDQSIGLAVQTYATQRAQDVQQRRDEHLAFLAHDLRSPLSAIALSATLLEMTLGDTVQDPEISQSWITLQRNVKHIQEMVDAVLKENVGPSDKAPTERLVRRRIDLWPLVETVMQDLRPIGNTNSTNLVNRVPVELMVYADAAALSRVLQNLLSNAIRHTPRGEVTVTAAANEFDGSVECCVADNGSGIPEEKLETLFERFETDGASEDGHGMGLAIVQEFIEAHGGEIDVESHAGRGTTFRFTLPGQ
jgi:signal transduction histidine kinase